MNIAWLWFWPLPWGSFARWPVLALFLLGAYHGINPGMGWLFAVALGLQEKSRGAVFRALPPMALGHLASVGLTVAALAMVQVSVPHAALRVAAAGIIGAFGIYRLARSRHPRWVGMQVGFRDLTLWSFLMASAHGAGLMLFPIVLSRPMEHHGLHFASPGADMLPSAAASSAAPAAVFATAASWLPAVSIHAFGYLLLTALVALLVYEKLGVAILRRAWLNLDLMWAIALVLTGIVTLFV